MSMITNVLNLTFLGNTFQDYLIFVMVTFGLYLIFSVIVTFTIKKLEKLAKKTKNNFDDITINALKKLKWPIFLIIILITIPTLLTVHNYIRVFSRYAIIIILTYEAIKIAGFFIDYATKKAEEKGEKNQLLKPLINSLYFLSSIYSFTNV